MRKWLDWVPKNRRVMTKQICVNGQQKMLLDDYLSNNENFPIFDYKNYTEIAEIAAEHLGFEISQSTVRGVWKQLIGNNKDVWESPLRKRKLSVRDEILNMKEHHKEHLIEQDRKFKIIFEKLHALSSNQNLQESFPFNNGGGDGAELVV